MTEAIWKAPQQQLLFRGLMRAMASPGEVVDASAWLKGERAYLGVLAALVDSTVSLSDPHNLLDGRSRTRLEATAAPPQEASCVVAEADRPPGFSPCVGELNRPERGATLVLCGAVVGRGDSRLALSGPGIECGRVLALHGFHPDWWLRRREWVAEFPLGVDMILVDPVRFAALPRTTQVKGG